MLCKIMTTCRNGRPESMVVIFEGTFAVCAPKDGIIRAKFGQIGGKCSVEGFSNQGLQSREGSIFLQRIKGQKSGSLFKQRAKLEVKEGALALFGTSAVL